ncbi:MAG: DEAD/DEAH box helicase [Puniceicoccales bacterium]|jgi:superfamily II DNA/RNA helicase|nr:DEAD/DEAH box helicase [Puniceicoccales bacterium]
MKNFSRFGLPESLVEALAKGHIKIPTPIQERSLPPAMEGKDLLASSQTGTGKTLAFLLPLISRLSGRWEEQALILTPTRELAIQIRDHLLPLLGPEISLRWALLIGGEPMGPQRIQLKRRPSLILGTPGRILDHLGRRTLVLDRVVSFVLDEMDRMLDMGFSEQIEDIVAGIPRDRQTFMFSATMSPDIIRQAQKYLRDPVRIAVESVTKPVQRIEQSVLHTEASNKFDSLMNELDQRQGSILIFVKTKMGAEKLAHRLLRNRQDAEALHGDLRQRQRDRIVRTFRDQKRRILVATDIAARGLDIPHIRHVINYDLPQKPEDYIHRIGRTARAGAEGRALSFILPSDHRQWRTIQRFVGENDSPPERTETGKPKHKYRKFTAFPNPQNFPASRTGLRRKRGPLSGGNFRSTPFSNPARIHHPKTRFARARTIRNPF